jgi:hypothetical protein
MHVRRRANYHTFYVATLNGSLPVFNGTGIELSGQTAGHVEVSITNHHDPILALKANGTGSSPPLETRPNYRDIHRSAACKRETL